MNLFGRTIFSSWSSENKSFTPTPIRNMRTRRASSPTAKFLKNLAEIPDMVWGFTLIELLVAVTIFSLVIGVALGIFSAATQAQRRSLVLQELLDQTSYVLEYMGRAIRMAKKDIDGNCTGGIANLNYLKTASGIKFESYKGECQEFFREWDAVAGVYRLKEVRAGKENYLTSPELDIISFNIGPDDSWDQNDNLQPSVTIFLNIKGTGKKPEAQPEIKIQTTVTQRNLDIQH